MTSIALPRTQDRNVRKQTQDLAQLVKLLAELKAKSAPNRESKADPAKPQGSLSRLSVEQLMQLIKGLSGFDAPKTARPAISVPDAPPNYSLAHGNSNAVSNNSVSNNSVSNNAVSSNAASERTAAAQTSTAVRTEASGTASSVFYSAADQKTRGDVARFHTEVAQWAKDGWIDSGTAQGLTSRLGHIDSLLAKGQITPDTQKVVDQFAGDAFRVQFGKAGQVDTDKVTVTLGKQIDEIVGKGLATPAEATDLRAKLSDLESSKTPGGSESWVKDAQDLRREIVDTARANNTP